MPAGLWFGPCSGCPKPDGAEPDAVRLRWVPAVGTHLRWQATRMISASDLDKRYGSTHAVQEQAAPEPGGRRGRGGRGRRRQRWADPTGRRRCTPVARLRRPVSAPSPQRPVPPGSADASADDGKDTAAGDRDTPTDHRGRVIWITPRSGYLYSPSLLLADTWRAPVQARAGGGTTRMNCLI
jgi:hypothetical protein